MPSSVPQTTFNIANVIMGVSLLTLPYAFACSGWIMGVALICFFGFVSATCARLLAACQLVQLRKSGIPLLTYGDIGEQAFGWRGRLFIQCIFSMELFAATVALHLLIVHSIMLLFEIDASLVNVVKVISWSVLTVTTWPRSLSILSYGSFLGVLCILNLAFVVVFDGLWKKEQPGSILAPMPTSIFPPNGIRAPLSFGLFMAGFAGHACFPGFYASMENPGKYGRAVRIAFGSAAIFYCIVGAAGYLMFGNSISQMLTEHLKHDAYPSALYYITMALIIVNPSTKYPLTLYPIILDLERVLLNRNRSLIRSDSQATTRTKNSDEDVDPNSANDTESLLMRGRPSVVSPPIMPRIIFRTFISALVLAVSIAIPSFERVLALLGSLFSTTSSVLFPILCWLALCGRKNGYSELSGDDAVVGSSDIIHSKDLTADDESEVILPHSDLEDLVVVTPYKRYIAGITLTLFALMAVTGTVWAVLPNTVIGQ